MRPIRLLLLLAFFIALPVFLTCVSLLSSSATSPQPLNAGVPAQASRLRILFSFATPYSLFPPSAIISLTNDNSTFFVARPAAFGPSLPSRGLSGQLWVGKGFGDEALLLEDDIRISGFELGCSDVPGWDLNHKKHPEKATLSTKAYRKTGSDESGSSRRQPKSKLPKREEVSKDKPAAASTSNDGTDDHLHHPLPDSNPASPAKMGEPADVNTQDKGRNPTHADIESLQESADIAGKIVMLSRGGCGFLEKVKWAQRRGGVALIVGDDMANQPLTVMYAKGDSSNVTIPALFTSYNAAHLLSSLVPPEQELEENRDGSRQGQQWSRGQSKDRDGEGNGRGVVFTSAEASDAKGVMAAGSAREDSNMLQNVLSAVGLVDTAASHADDSRRPPSSGNIDWVLLEDWDEDKPAALSSSTSSQTLTTSKATKTTTPKAKTQTSSSKATNGDDFIIGIQDWRDTDLIAPQPTTVMADNKQKSKAESKTSQSATSTADGKKALVTALKGGSITPGSGEYTHDEQDLKAKSQQKKSGPSKSSDHMYNTNDERYWLGRRVSQFFHHHEDDAHAKAKAKNEIPKHSPSKVDMPHNGKPHDKPEEREGLWVTLTPTSASTSPFFDTLLVLVVSPLVTLTVVYGLLLLRSRIRRRRWRAPKSIVEQLPVRTYHTMASSSSTTSSQLGSSEQPTDTSPLLRPSTRPRPRSQTTTGVLTQSPAEKAAPKPASKRKRYNGRQIECVVCLEEYVDGESRVMSLPCGHEFHVECITPWLVTRRRTCPICKGDVVRSITRSATTGGLSDASDPDIRQGEEQTSDEIQDQVAETVNEEGSAAIPIPVRDGDFVDQDVESGNAAGTPLVEPRSNQQGTGWRGIFGGSSSRLSGETVWRATPNDRTR